MDHFLKSVPDMKQHQHGKWISRWSAKRAKADISQKSRTCSRMEDRVAEKLPDHTAQTLTKKHEES